VKLRTQILLFFFTFALAPLLIAVVINLPLVLEKMELFYHKAHLQNLRADFRDLDQHLASRNEMVRLLAKLPEPGVVLDASKEGAAENIDMARARYIQWMNQILKDQLDIVQIVFLDMNGQEQFWLDRDNASQKWEPTVERPSRPPEDFITAAQQVESGRVLVSPISLDQSATDPRRFMTLRLISPIGSGDNAPAIGSVMISIDVGGMARYYRNTLWIHNDGSYLKHQDPNAPTGNAFDTHAGLKEIFAEEKPALWEGNDQQIMWIPMFRTEQSGALWVGRLVDRSPIAEFRNALTLRVLSIVFLLIAATWFASRWLAKRADRLGHELTDGIQHILEKDQTLEFHWKGPQELKRLGDNLSLLAAEHSRNTRNLRAHARELEESNRYKSQFLANISHELRTPLNSILLLSKLLSRADSGLSEEQLKQARVINEAGGDLQALIDNILDLSRIEARRIPVNLESINLPELLESLIELVQPQFDAKGLKLILRNAKDAPQRVISDPDKVRQILKNFLSNAVKFTDSGSVIISLTAQEKSSICDCELRISVQDFGIGIPEKHQGHIFEAFKQADGSTSRRFGGTGLGLAISRQLARLLGGEIDLQSQEGHGSTFSLLLPLEFDAERLSEDDVQHPPLPQPEEVDVKPPPRTRLGDRPVLVIDANVANLLHLTPMLEGWGLRVTAAGDLKEAREVLEEDGTFALALIDIMDSTPEGCDTIRQVRAASDMPLVAMLPEGEADAGCIKAECDAIIRRPLNPEELHLLLSSQLANGSNKTET
jgi:signal transduction histidine kinase